MPRHFSRKVDSNHAEIRDALRKIPSLRVVDTSRAGNGVPDLLVFNVVNGIWAWVEIKSSGGKLTVGEVKFREDWGGRAYLVAYTLDECLKYFDLVA